eukprot:GHVU01104833.1.p1 GENE.GHVU01104833.1~~GHVU01104833.1.p1  ORF type:complete len:110 (+),score=11.30 GHVU01104833.1:66-395(+)
MIDTVTNIVWRDNEEIRRHRVIDNGANTVGDIYQMLRQHEVVGTHILWLESKGYRPYVKTTGMWILANNGRNKKEKLTASELEIAFVEPNGASTSRYLHISISQYRFLV